MANINRNFGKLTGGELTYAPRSLVIDQSRDHGMRSHVISA